MDLKLKAIRELRGLTQQEMADRVGVKIRTYGTWERGERTLNAQQLVDCACALDCSTDELLGLDIRASFADPREAELHRIYHGLSRQGRNLVLRSAQAEYALERGGIEEKASLEGDTRRVG